MNKALSYVLSAIYKIILRGVEEQKNYYYKKSNRVEVGLNSKIYHTGSLDALREKSIFIGNNTHIRGRLVTYPSCGKIEVGNDCYVGENTQIWSEESIKIDDRVLIAHNCNIFDSSTHPIDKAERHDQYMKIISIGFPKEAYTTLNKKPIHIMDDVWIAANVTIMKGVTIGSGAIISAGSVVINDIPDNCIAAGNPAKVIKNLT